MYMKMKMTRNQVADLPVDKIVTARACELQDLLSGVDPIGYNAGICGWNYDVYVIGDVCILTGYRVLKKYPRAEKIEEYEREASKIVSSRMPSLAIISELNKLREAFVAEQVHD
ncbi:hypothetical protein [Butyricicoccus intestinisimiae]|uniref:Uncharacterized protein n=1 Tax=Butyricicoccus intestinisimiae TaxID=2841509 RepID=A0ABS6EU83_9FIRM|nr:hypothetical protein [Butyricicoccus intestinisimiae]MBU5491252.1 hypothetical protein [Butyricicoccus intestinisimiae]